MNTDIKKLFTLEETNLTDAIHLKFLIWFTHSNELLKGYFESKSMNLDKTTLRYLHK